MLNKMDRGIINYMYRC